MRVCALLFSIDASVSARGAYPAGSGPIWATSVTCTGEEDQLTDCNSATATSCTHTMDAGVMCNQTGMQMMRCSKELNTYYG